MIWAIPVIEGMQITGYTTRRLVVRIVLLLFIVTVVLGGVHTRLSQRETTQKSSQGASNVERLSTKGHIVPRHIAG